jgi:hypothetical protein
MHNAVRYVESSTPDATLAVPEQWLLSEVEVSRGALPTQLTPSNIPPSLIYSPSNKSPYFSDQ